MNILLLSSDALLASLRRQTVGQSWAIYQAQDADHVLDFAGTHVFGLR